MNEREFDKIFALMEESFPESERRTYTGQKELLADEHYRLLTETDNNNQIVAFFSSMGISFVSVCRTYCCRSSFAW